MSVEIPITNNDCTQACPKAGNDEESNTLKKAFWMAAVILVNGTSAGLFTGISALSF